MWGTEDFINGGLDLAMPGAWYPLWGDFWGDSLMPYVQNGTVLESRVDDAVRSYSSRPPLEGLTFHLPGRPRPNTLDLLRAS